MKQYELWWAELPPPVGRRPVLLLSRDGAYDYRTSVIVVLVTTTVRKIPTEVPVGRAEGLRQASVANLDNISVVPKSALEARIGALPGHRIREVKRALGWALDWYELKSP